MFYYNRSLYYLSFCCEYLLSTKLYAHLDTEIILQSIHCYFSVFVFISQRLCVIRTYYYPRDFIYNYHGTLWFTVACIVNLSGTQILNLFV